MKAPRRGFYEVRHRKGDKSVKDVIAAADRAIKLNKSVLGVVPESFRIDVAYSKEDFEKKTGFADIGTYTKCYAMHGRLVVMSPSVNKKAFQHAMSHELNHLFFHHISSKNRLSGGARPHRLEGKMRGGVRRALRMP